MKPSHVLYRVVIPLVFGHQFAITIGLLLVAVVDISMAGRVDSGSYRIVTSLQWAWALILGGGLFLLPESPCWYVRKDRPDDAAQSLSILRGQFIDSKCVKDELAELVANYRYKKKNMQAGCLDCFRGGWKPSSNVRCVFIGIMLQMMQQWTGVNFGSFVILFFQSGTC
jgi:hypothetical protein